MVHTAFGQLGAIEDGPPGLIRALRSAIGAKGTLVMPTMTDGASVFDPRKTPTHEMGVTAETFWRHPGVLRSTHPGASFAAQGPHSQVICKPQPLAPPHGPDSPVGRVLEADGKVLLLGVGHDANTMLHLAECIANVPYSVEHPCVVLRDGIPTTVMIPETDHCCEQFSKMDASLRAKGLQQEGPVGAGRGRLMRARDILDVALSLLRNTPLTFLCSPSAGCAECERARASLRQAP